MHKIQQHILRGGNYPRTINATRVSANEAAVQLLRRSTPYESEDIIPIGIAYHLSGTGHADYICLADPTEAFIVSFTSKAKATLTNDFAALLRAGGGANVEATIPAAEKVCLVGFNMARIAIQVNKATRLDVRGADLPMLLSPNAQHPEAPSALIASKLGPRVNDRAIDSLWIKNREEDVVIQAWLAAWYVIFLHQKFGPEFCG